MRGGARTKARGNKEETADHTDLFSERFDVTSSNLDPVILHASILFSAAALAPCGASVALIASRQYRKFGFPCLRRCVRPGTACRLFAARNYTAKNQLPKRQGKCLPQVGRAGRSVRFRRRIFIEIMVIVCRSSLRMQFTENLSRRAPDVVALFVAN